MSRTGRTGVDFREIQPGQWTYEGDSTLAFDSTAANGHPGAGWAALTLTGNRTLGLAADGDPIEAFLVKVEADGLVVGRNEGSCFGKAGFSAAVGAGKKLVGAVGGASHTDRGYIREAAATAAEAAKSRGAIIDGADPTSVIVRI